MSILANRLSRIKPSATLAVTAKAKELKATQLEAELAALKPKVAEVTALQIELAETRKTARLAEFQKKAAEHLKLQVSNQEEEIGNLKRQADRVSQIEAALDDRDRVQLEQSRKVTQYEHKIGVLEESLRKAETSDSTHSIDSPEYRRIQSELIGVNQQRDKYVDRIKSLEAQLKDSHRASNVTPINVSSQTTATSEKHAQRTPLFTPPAEKDDLKLIKGIGPVMEQTLNELGVTSFKQLGQFTKSDVDRVSDALEVFPGRIDRDEWISQAKSQYQEKYGLILNS